VTDFLEGADPNFLPDHGAIVDVISKTLHGWYPEISQESCDSFAFHIVHDVLTIRPVIDGVYSLYYGRRRDLP
jgi:hypothetical protein